MAQEVELETRTFTMRTNLPNVWTCEVSLEGAKRLGVLVNNAAMVFSAEYKRSYFDTQDIMMVNHLSPFVSTQALLLLMWNKRQKNLESLCSVLMRRGLYRMEHVSDREDFNRDFDDLTSVHPSPVNSGSNKSLEISGRNQTLYTSVN